MWLFQEADRLEGERVAREEREKQLAEEALERQLRPRRRRPRRGQHHEEQTQPTLAQKIKSRLGTILIVFIVMLMMLSLAMGLGLFRHWAKSFVIIMHVDFGQVFNCALSAAKSSAARVRVDRRANQNVESASKSARAR